MSIKTHTIQVTKSAIVSSFCSQLGLLNTIIAGGQTTVITGQGVVGTNTASTTGNNTVSQGPESFTSSTAVVHMELYFDSSVNPASNNSFGIGISQVNPFLVSSLPISAVTLTPSTSTIFDPLLPGSVGSTTITAGVYEIALDFNTSTGVMAWKDNAANSGTLTVVGFNSANPVYLLLNANAGDTLTDSVGATINGGDQAFRLPTIGSVAWCSV